MNTIALSRGNINYPPTLPSTNYDAFDTAENNHFCVFDSIVATRTFLPKTFVNIKKFDKNDDGEIYYKHADWLNLKWSRDDNRYQHLTFEFQMPLALGFTDNLFCVQTHADILEGLGRVNEIASSITGADCELAEKGKTKVVDANRDFADPNKLEYLELIKRLEIPRMKKTLYRTGVMYSTNQKKFIVYDKFAQLEAKHPHLPRFRRNFTESYLRAEMRLTDDALDYFLKRFCEPSIDKTPGKLLTPEFAEKMVKVMLRKLEMDADLRSFPEWSALVRDKYRPGCATRYIAYVERINRIGINRVRGNTKESIRHFYHIRSQLRKEGLDQLVFANIALEDLSLLSNDVWDF